MQMTTTNLVECELAKYYTRCTDCIISSTSALNLLRQKLKGRQITQQMKGKKKQKKWEKYCRNGGNNKS